ncbi:retrotransposon protein, putative, ty1-copia subclass, partial [Tanacetum coccineum]
MTLKNTPYPHQYIRRILYFGQISRKTHFQPILRTQEAQYAVPKIYNTPYRSSSIRRTQRANTPYPRTPIHRTGGAQCAVPNRSDTPEDEAAGDKETDQTPDLTDYQLARDRERRTRTKHLRFQDESNMVAYAFVAAEEEDTHEPLTYQEGVACENGSKWKAAMKEEMDSLRKNKTWELVDHPVGKKLVSFQHTSIRVILALTACKDYELEQLDVKTAFYMEILKKRFDEYMLSNGFKRSSYDNCVYYMSYAPGEYIYLLLYVDDMLIACKSKAEIGSTKSLLKKEFDMKELGEAKKILGMEIVRDRSRKILRVSQSGDCPVRDCDAERMSKVPYTNAVGSLMYMMVCTRPDIAYAGTANVGLVYGTNRGNHVDVTGFVDSNNAKDSDK